MITLAAEDWYETVAFYNELLGLELLQSDELRGRARLDTGSGVILEIHSGGWGSEGPKTPRENPVALCLRVESLERVVGELEFKGACLLTAPESGLVALMDPEGNRVCLYDTPSLPEAPDGWEGIGTGGEE